MMLLVGVFIGAMMPSGPMTAPEFSATSAQAETPSTSDESASERTSAPRTNANLGSGAVTLDRASDGHFYADVRVNGTPVKFMIDTGASGIALTREDARRAGVALSSMDQVVGSGASGEVTGQFVTLSRVNLGTKEVRGVEAAVLNGGTQSLLGQSFLSQFGSISIERNKMMLR
jgi:aspartyl protease family protein